MEKLAISIPEAAKLIGISKSNLYTLSRSKGFPVIDLGGRKLVSVKGLEAWVAKMSGEEALKQ